MKKNTKKKNAKKSICYRVCDKNGWTKFDSLDDLDSYLERTMEEGYLFWPIKRIVRVVSEEIPLPEAVLRYNEAVEKKNGGN